MRSAARRLHLNDVPSLQFSVVPYEVESQLLSNRPSVRNRRIIRVSQTRFGTIRATCPTTGLKAAVLLWLWLPSEDPWGVAVVSGRRHSACVTMPPQAARN
jgi:hypothetical protein